MSEKITFSYFYGQEADLLSFYRIPKLLFTSDAFRELSTDGKVLYGLMLDRMSLSIKNPSIILDLMIFPNGKRQPKKKLQK